MPRFIANGPVVPDKLVQDVEDDRVVLFCGAGISMGAGLPSYAGLVAHCYTELGKPLPPDNSDEWSWPDRLLGTLESLSGPDNVRRKVAERLLTTASDPSLHAAILKLASLRRFAGVRLVTTNFDRYFEQAEPSLATGQRLHSGPILPIPKNDLNGSWRSLVYLHGRLNDVADDNSHLILSSADFGRAYLTEAWAARFVTRLFSEFTVLFVGYSLNDPVLRYMTDAFAADESAARGGRARSPAYIFVPFRGRQSPDPTPWRNRKLEPIFYNQRHDHSLLRKSLIAWADVRQDYLSSIGRIIRRDGPKNPVTLSPSITNNVLWAAVGRPHDRGHGARLFAKLRALPPIEWLFEFEKREEQLRAQHDELAAEAKQADRDVPVAPPYPVAELIPQSGDRRAIALSEVSQALASWLVRHLENVELAEWLIRQMALGKWPHAEFRFQIRDKLDQGLVTKPGFLRFWRLVSSEGSWNSTSMRQYPSWLLARRLTRNPSDPTIRLELMSALRPVPKFEISNARSWNPDLTDATIGTNVSDVADVDVQLVAAEHLDEIIQAVQNVPSLRGIWTRELGCLVELLKDALEIYAVAGVATVNSDPGVFHRPSIIPHAQNANHFSWTRLIDLIWYGWLDVDALDREASRSFVTQWRRAPFATMRRLALAAITHSQHYTPSEKLDVLING